MFPLDAQHYLFIHIWYLKGTFKKKDKETRKKTLPLKNIINNVAVQLHKRSSTCKGNRWPHIFLTAHQGALLGDQKMKSGTKDTRECK